MDRDVPAAGMGEPSQSDTRLLVDGYLFRDVPAAFSGRYNFHHGIGDNIQKVEAVAKCRQTIGPDKRPVGSKRGPGIVPEDEAGIGRVDLVEFAADVGAQEIHELGDGLPVVPPAGAMRRSPPRINAYRSCVGAMRSRSAIVSGMERVIIVALGR